MRFQFQWNWSWVSIFVFQLGFLTIQTNAYAADGFSIPVRLSVMAGYNSLTTSFGEERKDDSFGGVGVGADFNVPIKKTGHMVGITGWLGTPSHVGKTTYAASLIFGAYYGYSVGRFDFYLGPGFSSTSLTLEDAEAGTDQSVKYSATMGCGMAGTRYYPFGGKKITGGIALSGFYCGTGGYKKKVRSMTNIETETTVQERSSSVGGLISIFIGWDDERKVF